MAIKDIKMSLYVGGSHFHRYIFPNGRERVMFGWEQVSRDDPYYRTCVAASTLGMTAIGTSMGSMTLPGLGTVAGWAGGAAMGFTAGYLACPYLAPTIKKKFEQGLTLSTTELRQAGDAMGRYAGVQNASDAIKLLAVVRVVPGGGTCVNPAVTARKILRG